MIFYAFVLSSTTEPFASLVTLSTKTFDSTWRPISDVPVCDWPLALCDGSTVDLGKTLRCTMLDTDEKGNPLETGVQMNLPSNLYVPYDDAHKWYYVSRQIADEVLVFKSFDSADVTAKACPHASFKTTQHSVIGSPSRKSIETRHVVIDLKPDHRSTLESRCGSVV